MTKRNTEGEGDYVCPECGEEWKVEGRWDAEGDFEPINYSAINCPECDNVGDYQERL
jgi:DNA-directed RNA polymerase subunit RPC12/RpoP